MIARTKLEDQFALWCADFGLKVIINDPHGLPRGRRPGTVTKRNFLCPLPA